MNKNFARRNSIVLLVFIHSLFYCDDLVSVISTIYILMEGLFA